jgi:CheY-like chemotaxis protein
MNQKQKMTRHLLVVDDDLGNRMLPGLFMRDRGWHVTECGNTEEAHDALTSGLITHVLLDISLPRVSGLQFCRQLRSSAIPGRLFIYAYTAHAMTSERDEFVRAGFDGILIKPIRQGDLIALLE